MDDTLAIILGGGKGSGLHPLTAHRAKPAVPLAGKYRLIDVPVSMCIHSGVSRVFVLTQYNSASLNRHLGRAYRFDRFGSGFVSLLAAERTSDSGWYQGSADAVRQSLPHVDVYPHRLALVLSGDQLFRLDARAMVAHHREHWADATLGCAPVTAEQARAQRIVTVGADGFATAVHERPERLDGLESAVSDDDRAAGRVYLAAMGAVLFERDVLREALLRDPDRHHLFAEVLPAAVAGSRVAVYRHGGYWSDIGTIRSYYEASLALARPREGFDLHDERAPVFTSARMLPPAAITDARIRGSLVAEAAVVRGATVESSIVGIRAVVDAGAEVRRAVVLGSDYLPWTDPAHRLGVGSPDAPGIGAGSHVENAIVDKNAQIGRDCRISNADGRQHADGPGYSIRDGVVVIHKNAVIADGTVI